MGRTTYLILEPLVPSLGIFFIDFLDELGLFIGKNRFLRKKNVSRIRQKTFYLQFCMGTPEGHQKSIFNTSNVKKKQSTYGRLNPKT
jgi:hypothetical protein